ncbi:unnamed protein product [Phytophthora fragariaefolia]|uniref:Unnamed protein product n=1 Tax=Phytophthora fragariaefolia TaxID=1490495 RepID=A0A9W6XSE7_9STRA|nr:unnamed protein product [Phytophthora fragariaefolia]
MNLSHMEQVHKVMAIQASPHPYARHALGSTYSDGSVRVWDLSTGQLTAEFIRQHEAPSTALTLSPVSKVLLATGGLDGRPPEPVSSSSQSNGFTQQPSSRSFASHLSPKPASQSMDERRQSAPSPVSFLSTLSRTPSSSYLAGSSPLKQTDSGIITMRAEIQRLREEMELRRQEEVDQLSSLLENLMSRFDAVVEENRSLREENEWLKSHVPPS